MPEKLWLQIASHKAPCASLHQGTLGELKRDGNPAYLTPAAFQSSQSKSVMSRWLIACHANERLLFVVWICLRNSDGAAATTNIHPSSVPDLDAPLPTPASCGRALPLERSAAMGVKLSASEASQPIWAKTPQGAAPCVQCSHFRYTWRLKTKKKKREKKQRVCNFFKWSVTSARKRLWGHFSSPFFFFFHCTDPRSS